jgi:hypothetical protein
VPSSISTGVDVSVFVPLLIESVFVTPATDAGNGNSTVTPAAWANLAPPAVEIVKALPVRVPATCSLDLPSMIVAVVAPFVTPDASVTENEVAAARIAAVVVEVA